MKKQIFLIFAIAIVLFIVLENAKAITPDELKSNPSLVKGLSDEKFVSLLNQNSDLLYDNVIFENLHARAMEDVKILNDNPKIRDIWIWRVLGLKNNDANVLSLKIFSRSSMGETGSYVEKVEVITLGGEGGQSEFEKSNQYRTEEKIPRGIIIDKDGKIDFGFSKLNGIFRGYSSTQNTMDSRESKDVEMLLDSNTIKADSGSFSINLAHSNNNNRIYFSGKDIQTYEGDKLKFSLKNGQLEIRKDKQTGKTDWIADYAKLLTEYVDDGKIYFSFTTDLQDNCPFLLDTQMNNKDSNLNTEMVLNGKLILNLKNCKRLSIRADAPLSSITVISTKDVGMISLSIADSLIEIKEGQATLYGKKPKEEVRYLLDGKEVKLNREELVDKGQTIAYRAAAAWESDDYLGLKQKLNEEYSVEMRDNWLEYISFQEYSEVVDNLFAATEEVNQNPQGIKVDPSFLYTVMVTEVGGPLNGDALEDSYLVGMHSFGELAPKMKEKGFLKQDFEYKAIDESKIGARGYLTKSEWTDVEFDSVNDGFIGTAAYLAYVRYLFKLNCQAKGINYESIPPDEQNAWNYYYYNAGPGDGKKLLETQGKNAFKGGWQGKAYNPSQLNGRDKRFTAFLVTATNELYKELNIFNPLPLPKLIDDLIPKEEMKSTSSASGLDKPLQIKAGTAFPWQYNYQ